MIYSQNYPLYCQYIIRHILAPILRDLLDWGEKVAGISKLAATLKNRSDDSFRLIKKTKNKYANAQSKSLAAHPCNRPFAVKHLLSCHRNRFVDRFLQLDRE